MIRRASSFGGVITIALLFDTVGAFCRWPKLILYGVGVVVLTFKSLGPVRHPPAPRERPRPRDCTRPGVGLR
jgi:hypothetical protein